MLLVRSETLGGLLLPRSEADHRAVQGMRRKGLYTFTGTALWFCDVRQKAANSHQLSYSGVRHLLRHEGNPPLHATRSSGANLLAATAWCWRDQKVQESSFGSQVKLGKASIQCRPVKIRGLRHRSQFTPNLNLKPSFTPRPIGGPSTLA